MRDALEEAKRARRVAKVRGFETEQYALFSEVSEHADRLETEIESARESYEGAYAVPDAPSRMKGFPRSIADELERVREPVATVLRVAASMSTFRSAPGNEETDGAKLASATDGRGAKGDGAYLAESMFRGAQPYAFIRAFVEAAKMSLADFPMLAHDALALEGGEDVNLADAVTPLIDSLQSESNVRWLELPKFGSADETVLYAALTRVHNHLVDFRVARLRINTDAVEEGDFDLLLSGPEDAAMEWSFVKQAKGLPTASRQRLKPLDDVIATARAQGRLDTLARQGFIDGETDLDEVMMTLDVSASQVIKNHDAAVAEAKRRSPGSAVAPSHVDAVRRYLAKVNATQQAKDRLAAAQQEGVIPKAIKASSLPKDVISILQNVTMAGIETLNAVLGAEITELERRGSLFFGANQPIADVDALFTDNSKQLAVASAHSDQLTKYASRLEKVGVIGDILSIGTGLYQIATASSRSEVVSGAIDVASGAVGLGLFAASKSTSMTMAAGGGAAAAPVAFMFAYLKIIHESLGGAYRNFRSANAGLRSDEINRILDAMDTATASAVRGAAAAKLMKDDKEAAAQSVFAEALDQAIKDTVRVDRACRVMTHPAQRSDADPLAELTEVAALYAGWDEERSRLGIPYKLKTLPAITALEPPPKDVADKAKGLNVHGGTIIDAAVTLASGAADWVARSIRT